MPQKLLTYHIPAYLIYFPLSVFSHYLHCLLDPPQVGPGCPGVWHANSKAPRPRRPHRLGGKPSPRDHRQGRCAVRQAHVGGRCAWNSARLWVGLGLSACSGPSRPVLAATFNTSILLVSFQRSWELLPREQNVHPLRMGKDNHCQCFMYLLFSWCQQSPGFNLDSFLKSSITASSLRKLTPSLCKGKKGKEREKQQSVAEETSKRRKGPPPPKKGRRGPNFMGKTQGFWIQSLKRTKTPFRSDSPLTF